MADMADMAHQAVWHGAVVALLLGSLGPTEWLFLGAIVNHQVRVLGR